MKTWNTKLHFTLIVILSFGQQCSNEVIQVGNQIVPSDKGINVPGNTFLFTKSIPHEGVVVAVTSFFRNRNPAIFQIWRPAISTSYNQDPSFRLEHSALVYPRVTDIVDTVPMEDFLMIGNDLCLQVQPGDRLGVFVETVPSSVTYDWAFQPAEVYVHSVSSPSLYPEAGNVVVFDSLYFPFHFSVKADIDTGDLNSQGQRDVPTCEMVLENRRPVDVTVTASYREENITEAPCREGPPGPEGPGGFNGTDGAQGLPGEKGDKGSQGVPGVKGDSGAKGDVGQKGTKGDMGEIGQGGPTGLVGIQGVPGERGQKGNQGEIGEKGSIGEKGTEGNGGPKGDPGIAGPKGDIGAIGPKGDRGDAGLPGSSAAGIKGETGKNGDQGIPGSKGETGDPGQPGVPGEKGDSGERGSPGPPGPPGTSKEPDFGASATNNCEDCYHITEGLIAFIIIWQLILTVAFIIFCFLYCRKTLLYKNRVSDISRRTSAETIEPIGNEFENTIIKTTGKYETNISWEFCSTAAKTKTGHPAPNGMNAEAIWLSRQRQRPKPQELKFDSLEEIENDLLAKETRNQLQKQY